MSSSELKYPFMQTQSSLWKNCQKIQSKWRNLSKSHVNDLQKASTTSTIDYSNVFRLPKNETELENMKVLSTQQAFGIEFIKNEIILSKCAGSKTGSVFHLGGLPGAGKTATITSLIEELADVNMTGKGSVMMVTKTNAAKFNLLSACVDPNIQNQYFHESNFVTVNSGFAIPVLNTCADAEDYMIESYADILATRFLNIALSDIVVMDEYTMTGCYDILYMDCLMRTVTGRHDVPFGGTPIIFLGDNRQNSAVIDNRTTAACKNEKDQFKGKENDNDGANVFENNYNSISSKVFMGMLSRLHGRHDFFDIFMSVCRIRHAAISDRLKYVSECLDHTVRLYDKKKEKSSIPTIAKKRRLEEELENDQQQEPVPEKKQKKEVSTVEDKTETDNVFDDFETFFTNEIEMEMVALVERYDDHPPKARMTNRLEKLEIANLFFRKQVTGKEMKMGSCNLERIKNAGFGLLREEALRSELDYLDRFLSCPSKDEAMRRVMDVMYEIRNFARMAFSEIDNTGRERMYILSAMTDVIPNCHVISLANEEIINIKLSCGRDKYCLDSVECSNELGDEESRISNTSDAVMNAFFRTGDEVKYNGSLCQTFKENLEKILNYVEKVSTFEELKDLARLLVGDKSPTSVLSSTKKNCDDGLDYDDEIFFGDNVVDDDGEAEDLIIRKDSPPEIGFNMRTSERVKKIIEFIPTYHSVIDKYSDIARARMWHVYLLARNLQTLNVYKSCVISPFSKKSASPQSEKEFHEPYWIRALSLPTSPSIQIKNLQSAYSAFLSLNSRTFLMSSQKRISISKHALGMMYSLSLFDMTVDLNTLIDSRDVFGNKPPIGCSFSLSHEDYFQTIYPSAVSEFLIVSRKSVGVELDEIQKAEGNKIDLQNINTVIDNLKDNRHEQTENNIFIGASLLTSIARDNILFNRRQRQFEEESKDSSFKDKVVAKNKRPYLSSASNGAIALTRKNSCKNMISELVDKTIKASQAKKSNKGGPMSVSFKTEFSVGHINLTNVEFDVGARNRATIMGLCDKFNKMDKVFIDKYIDANLRRTFTNQREFTKQLLKIRNDVTKVQTIEFFIGQTVTFTHSNILNNSPYDCTAMFYTTDTGTIIDMYHIYDKLVLSIMVNRTGEIANVRAGNKTFGVLHNGRYGAHVRYFPVNSSHAVTFYSSQGHTYKTDVIVDVSHASIQDIYVALTRNEDVLQLKVMSLPDSKLKRLLSIKACMGRDKTTLFPIGALRGTKSVDVIDFLQLFDARTSFADDGISNDQIRLQYAIRDNSRDLVSTAQSFIMDLSGNSFSFNTEWMRNTGIILSHTGLYSRLEQLENAFFDKATPRSVIDAYNSKTNNTLMQLYVCSVRAALHYMLSTISKPGQKALKDYMNRTSDPGYVMFHPAFINRPMRPENIESFFFDLAPHSFVTKIFQFYAHFIFMVYEQCHICLTAFSFIPSQSPVFNASVRVKMDKKTLDEMQGKSEMTNLVRMFIPGGGLAYEPKEFKESMDGYIRLDRDTVTKSDYNSDKVRNEIDSYVATNVANADVAMAKCGEYQKKNLRRKGKYCRPGEAVGLSKHGTIAVACDKESLNKANIHIMDKEWVSFSNEANLYGMLRFMTRLAAASGVTVVDINKNASNFPDEGFRIEDLPIHDYSINMSNEILYCGQCDPFFKVQFLIHCFKRSKSSIKKVRNSCDSIFGKCFEKGLTRGRGFKECLKVIMTTDNFSHTFISSVKTSDVRNSLFMGIGKVKKEEVTSLVDLEKFIVECLSRKIFNRLSFFVSARI